MKFTIHTVGVHIRRTDHRLAIVQNPDEIFINAVKKRINEDVAANFYICSDDANIKHLLLEMFGRERILLPKGELSRCTLGGCQQAVIELFSLAATGIIIGSKESSFSEMANYLRIH